MPAHDTANHFFFDRFVDGLLPESAVRRYKYRFDVRGHAFQPLQRFLHLRTQRHHLAHQLFVAA